MGELTKHITKYVQSRVARAEITRPTAQRIGYCLAGLARAHADRPADTVNARTVQRWLAQNQSWNAGTRALYVTYARAFCVWLRHEGVINVDPFAEVKPPPRPRAAPRPIANQTLPALLSHCPDERARCIVTLMWVLGLRCCGVAALQVDDIDWVSETLTVTEKGGHSRRLPLTPEVAAAIERLLTVEPAQSGPLIRSRNQPTAGIAAQHVGRLVGDVLRSAGIKQRARDGKTAHALRHTALTAVAEATADPWVVAELAGWAHISTAAVYVRRASTCRVREALLARGDRQGAA